MFGRFLVVSGCCLMSCASVACVGLWNGLCIGFVVSVCCLMSCVLVECVGLWNVSVLCDTLVGVFVECAGWLFDVLSTSGGVLA